MVLLEKVTITFEINFPTHSSSIILTMPRVAGVRFLTLAMLCLASLVNTLLLCCVAYLQLLLRNSQKFSTKSKWVKVLRIFHIFLESSISYGNNLVYMFYNVLLASKLLQNIYSGIFQIAMYAWVCRTVPRPTWDDIICIFAIPPILFTYINSSQKKIV